MVCFGESKPPRGKKLRWLVREMEENMFDLEQSIAEWRRQMLAAGIKTPVPLEDLEIHLREWICKHAGPCELVRKKNLHANNWQLRIRFSCLILGINRLMFP